MEEDRAVISSGLLITPDAVSARTFATARRGYHPEEVRQFLGRVADELASAAARETELRRALQEALSRAAHPELDEEALTAGLGEHAARLIASARESAAAIVADAEELARRLREESEGLMARRVEEAETAGASIRQAAETEMRAARDRARAEAEAVVAGAQAQGKEMVNEARAVRERMLSDLGRRRRAAQVQVDQLRAGRQRLLDAYGVVRRTLEEATDELDAAEAEARVAAEDAGRRAVESDIVVRPDPDSATRPAKRLAAAPTPAAPEAAATAPDAPPMSAPEAPSAADAPPASTPSPTPAPSHAAAHPAPPTPSPAPAPAPAPPAPSPAPALALTHPGPSPEGQGRYGRAVATLDPPRRPAMRPQSVAEAAPPRTRPLAVVEAGPAPVPVAEPATGPPPIVEPARAKVDDLFARIRQEVPAHRPQPEPEPEGETSVTVDVADENALSRRDEVLEPIESDLTRALKRVLQDEQNEVLDRIRRTRSTAPDAVLPDRPAQIERYRAAASPLLVRATSAGAGAGGPGDADADGMAEVLARELVEPLRSRLEDALAVGTGDEGGLFESISSIYRQWKVQQVEKLARHTSASAFARGRFEATPGGAALRWLVDDEGGRCPDCDDNALAGPVAKGEPFPTGQLHPPAHPGCRCLLVAAVP